MQLRIEQVEQVDESNERERDQEDQGGEIGPAPEEIAECDWRDRQRRHLGVGKTTFERELKNGVVQETTIDLTISSGIMIWDINEEWNTGALHKTIMWQAKPRYGEEGKEPIRSY